MNCIAVIDPRKKTVGTASACTASQRTVKIGYEFRFFDAIIRILLFRFFYSTKNRDKEYATFSRN